MAPDVALAMIADRTDTAGGEMRELLGLAKAGDASAFEAILILHERRVFLTALRMLGRVEDAQDAAQEVFLRLHKHLRRFDDGREFAPWLYRMTVNACRDIAKARPREEQLDEIERGYVADPAVEIGRGEQKRTVAAGLRTLAEKERAAIVLREIEGLSTKEVARILGSSEVTVRSQVSTGRQKLREFVTRLGRRLS